MTEAILERAKRMWKVYTEVACNIPLYENPALDPDMSVESHEVLVTCECGKEYRFYANSNNPLPELTEENAPVYCPVCERHCSEFRTLSGHSCGTFNVTITKGIASSEFQLSNEVTV